MLNDTDADGDHKITSVVRPAKSDESAMPATIIRSTERPVPLRDSAPTRIVVASEAHSAIAEYNPGGAPNAIAAAIASAAPALVPVRYASISGLPSKSCITSP